LNSSRLRSGPYHFACKNRSKIDYLFGVVVKTNTQRVRGNNLEGPDSINRMTHNMARWALGFALLAAAPNSPATQLDVTPPKLPPAVSASSVKNPRSVRRDQCRRSRFSLYWRHYIFSLCTNTTATWMWSCHSRNWIRKDKRPCDRPMAFHLAVASYLKQWRSDLSAAEALQGQIDRRRRLAPGKPFTPRIEIVLSAIRITYAPLRRIRRTPSVTLEAEEVLQQISFYGFHADQLASHYGGSWNSGAG
jgi:hypothetical protein